MDGTLLTRRMTLSRRRHLIRATISTGAVIQGGSGAADLTRGGLGS
jgi:hypothetical protein